MALEWKRSPAPHMELSNALVQSMHHKPSVLPPSPPREGKLGFVTGSWQKVKPSLNVPSTTLQPAVHLESLFFNLNQAHKGKRQKATILTLKVLWISAGLSTENKCSMELRHLPRWFQPNAMLLPGSDQHFLFPLPSPHENFTIRKIYVTRIIHSIYLGWTHQEPQEKVASGSHGPGT